MKFRDFRAVVVKNIVRHRRKAGFTQEALAEKAGLNFKYYQRIEQEKQNLTLRTMWKICRALDLHPHDLFQPIRKKNP